jgi:two-component system response regulator AtoC
VIERLRTVSSSPHTPVLLTGASGVGKQYAAEFLHGASLGNDAPFVDVNCAALPDELVESELFGHEKGAFTDARSTRRGMIELANGGTLFLDEITTLPLRSQAKLLKFLDGMRFRRVGGEREIQAQLRVVAATNVDVRQQVLEGTFREDLFHRLAVFQVQIPALSERKEDIEDLARSFVQYFSARLNKQVLDLRPDALSALARYVFPGNVRELRNVIERAVILARGQEITERELLLPANSPMAAEPSFFGIGTAKDGSPPKLDEVEKRYVARVLDHFEGRRMAAAAALGISYPTFLKKLRELELADG